MVAKSTYHGDYEGLYEAWRQFGELAEKELAAQQGFKRGSSIWEVYAFGPESDQDPATWRTGLFARLESIE
jgi:effector-binding domain-containing protein